MSLLSIADILNTSTSQFMLFLQMLGSFTEF